MLEDLKAIEDDVGVLVDWIVSMKDIVQNPYSNGLNIPKILNDLSGYAADLMRKVVALEKKIEPEQAENQETERAESTTAEQ